MDSWEKVASNLMLSSEFGAPIERPNNWLDKDVNDTVGNAGSWNQLRQI